MDSQDWRIVCRCSAHIRCEFERAKMENVFRANWGLASYQIIYGVEDQIKELGLTSAENIT